MLPLKTPHNYRLDHGTSESAEVTTRIFPAGSNDLLLGWIQPIPGVETVVSRLGSSVSHTNSTEKVTQTKSGSVFRHWHEKKNPTKVREALAPKNFPKLRNSLSVCVSSSVCVCVSRFVGQKLLLSHDLSVASTGSWRWAGLSNSRSRMRVCFRMWGKGVLRVRFRNFITEFLSE